MNATLEKVENSEAYLEFVIEAAKLEEGMEKSYKKNVKNYHVPGFRKGSAPRYMLEAKYGPEVLYGDAVDFIVPDEYYAAIRELNLKTIGEPDIEVGYIVKGKPVNVKVRVPVKPEVILGSLEGLEIKVPQPYAVTEKDVEKYLQDLCSKNKIVIDKEQKPAAQGDTVTIDYECSVDGSLPGGKEQNMKVVLGADTFFPGLEEKLVGVKKGDHLHVETTFPQNHPATQLAGKRALFKIKVKNVENIQPWELNDQFAQQVAKMNSLEELRSDARRKLSEIASQRDLYGKKQAVIKALLDTCEFDVPDSLVMQQAQLMLEEFTKRVSAEGGSIELYLQMTNTDFASFKKQLWEDAKMVIRTNCLLEKIIEEKAFEVSDEELKNGIEAFGIRIGMAKENAKKENLGPLVDKVLFDLKADKAVAYLLEHACIAVEDKKEETTLVNLQL
ncbi:trigger factor [Sporomusa acidovorans]|uniref:Trigger factor n=1 Tax=Sporomusa acidovorans (strain ATCC 49682 / DSM 3132 / Mol) TaxID=1123286 RepID=A0ABZ3J0C7_SPOA4|nr:trigger factor [Sporomusa acidovorans]OZC22813.1 trigger factor [Sporomusa acidovorans DSM 3132]SDE51719.1 trigger factor [Sporomusa acidovorans]